MDPLTQASIIQGAAGELTKEAISIVKISGKWIKKYLDDQLLERSRPQADKNLADYDGVFAHVDATNRAYYKKQGRDIPAIEDVLEDPDAAHALKASMYSASRSSSTEMHHRLAELLSARFAMKSGTEKAVVMNRAIEVMSNLGHDHLRILGMLASIYAARPPHDPVLQELTDRMEKERGRHSIPQTRAQAEADPSNMARDLSYAYMSSKIAELVAFDGKTPVSQQDVLHLASEGCVNYDASALRDLAKNLSGYVESKDEVGWRFHYAEWDGHSLMNQWPQSDGLDEIVENWESVLQYCSLTPVGVVIGLLVHDHKFETTHLKTWQWSDMPVSNIVSQVWDGKEIDEGMLDKMVHDVMHHRRFEEQMHDLRHRN